MRDGEQSWSAQLAAILQGRCVQLLLVALLLIDVGLVFGEIFLEAYYPSCRAVRRSAVSCCPADPIAPASAIHAIHGEGTLLEVAIHGLTTAFGDPGYLNALHAQDACVPPLVSTAHEIGCEVNPFWHAVHVSFSVLSFLILAVFSAEIGLLLATFRELSLRSAGILLDVVVVSLAMYLQWEVLKVELGALDPDESWSGKQLTTLVLLFRFVRFVRVYHGISSSIHQQQHQQMHALKEGIGKLDTAVGALVAHVPLNKHLQVEEVYELFRQVRQQLENTEH